MPSFESIISSSIVIPSRAGATQRQDDPSHDVGRREGAQRLDVAPAQEPSPAAPPLSEGFFGYRVSEALPLDDLRHLFGARPRPEPSPAPVAHEATPPEITTETSIEAAPDLLALQGLSVAEDLERSPTDLDALSSPMLEPTSQEPLAPPIPPEPELLLPVDLDVIAEEEPAAPTHRVEHPLELIDEVPLPISGGGSPATARLAELIAEQRILLERLAEATTRYESAPFDEDFLIESEEIPPVAPSEIEEETPEIPRSTTPAAYSIVPKGPVEIATEFVDAIAAAQLAAARLQPSVPPPVTDMPDTAAVHDETALPLVEALSPAEAIETPLLASIALAPPVAVSPIALSEASLPMALSATVPHGHPSPLPGLAFGFALSCLAGAALYMWL